MRQRSLCPRCWRAGRDHHRALRPQSFTFVSREDSVPAWSKHHPRAREKVDEALLTVDVLAQVTDIWADVYTLDDTIDFDGAQTVLERAGTFPRECAPQPTCWASC